VCKLANENEACSGTGTSYSTSVLNNHLVKEQRKHDKDNATKHQEKMYHEHFWEFSQKLCKGTLDKEACKPTFSKSTADNYYPQMYSSATTFNPSSLSWFPRLHEPTDHIPFFLGPIKPKEIKKLLMQKKSTSAPGPDGITYGILRNLPSTHHFLATLYSQILLVSPNPPSYWQDSNITLIYKRNETDNPKNFRMIALTSTIAKLFHQIISNRSLDYLIANGYIKDSVQKAFIKNKNGTIEHNQLLQEVISHSRHNNKTCHITFKRCFWLNLTFSH
jgi:hypothetical protein